MFFKIIPCEINSGLDSAHLTQNPLHRTNQFKEFSTQIVYKLVNLHVPGWKSVGQASLIEYINKRVYRHRSQNDNFSKCFHHMNENHMELF